MKNNNRILLVISVVTFCLGFGLATLSDIPRITSSGEKQQAQYLVERYSNGTLKGEGFIRNGIDVKYNLSYFLYPEDKVMSIYVFPDYPENHKKMGREFYRISFDTSGSLKMFEYYERGKISNQLKFDRARIVEH